jgi:1,4-alpha-glucan branching enzyme
VARKIPHLSELGVTAIQLLPIQEFQSSFSLGYNGTDYFSPEMDFAVEEADLGPYAAGANALLDAKGLKRYDVQDLRGEMNQLKALIDLWPYLRACGDLRRSLQPRGRRFRRSEHVLLRSPAGLGRQQQSLYFTDRGTRRRAVFDYAKPEVRDFLIQNAKVLPQ